MNAQYAAHGYVNGSGSSAHDNRDRGGSDGVVGATNCATEADPEMQTMWQFLDTSFTNTNNCTRTTAAPNESTRHEALLAPMPIAPMATQSQSEAVPAPPSAAMVDPPVDSPATDDDNGVYNELGDVFSMFFNLDSDPNDANAPNVQQNSTNLNQKVQLARTMSSTSSHCTSSPGGLLGYPSMSPATMNWLHSLATSASCESLTGLISPATMTGFGTSTTPIFGTGAGSANGFLSGDTSTGSANGLQRTPSCELIDWKAYNDACNMAEKMQKEAPKWRVIPQHGPHADPTTAANAMPTMSSNGLAKPPPAAAPSNLNQEGGLRKFLPRHLQSITSTVASIVGAALSSPNAASQQNATNSSILAGVKQETQQPPAPAYAQPLSNEEKSKRKAVISPEYVQYGSSAVGTVPLGPSTTFVDPQHGQFATQVPDPTGRRPSKKTLHQVTTAQPPPEHRDDGPIRCKCTGKCRNARCACVKAGFVCGTHCKCVSCANPFVPMANAGIDIQTMAQDVCLMQYLSKVKDMQELLESFVAYDCCHPAGTAKAQVKHVIERGWTCPDCQATFTYSWCTNKLCHDQKKPRKHCAKCRRCGDHRNEHCDDCNHCYFAGVANSFSCSCKANKNGQTAVGNSAKSRAVVLNPSLQEPQDQSSSIMESKTKEQDENTKPLAANGARLEPETTASLSSGLSSSEPEKEDSCPVQ